MRLQNVARRQVATLCLTLLCAASTATYAAATLEDANRLAEQVIQLYARESLTEALPLAQQVLAIRERLLGAEHLDTAKALRNLATLQTDLGNYALAESMFLRAIAVLERVNGPNDPETLIALNNLGLLYDSMGDYAKTEATQLRVLAACEKHLGLEHKLTSRALLNLSKLYTTLGKYDRAESLALRALPVLEKTEGPESPVVATIADNLGILYVRRGEYSKAEPLFERALRIREKALGSEHPTTTIALDHLAVLYDNIGALRKAEALLLRVIAIRERTLGASAELTGRALEHLGVVYGHMGKPAKGEPLLQRALRINEAKLGPDSLDTAWTLSNLAGGYFDMGAYTKSEEFSQRALQIQQKVLGDEAPEVASSLHILASLHAEVGEYDQAEALHQRALAMRERVLGPGHPYTATSLEDLATVYRARGELDKTEALLKRTLAVREKALGSEHPYTLSAITSLGSLYRNTGAFAQSEKLLQRALDVQQQRTTSADDPHLRDTLSELAKLYYATGRRAPAVRLQTRACDSQRRVMGLEHPYTATCLNDLALMHWGSGAHTLAEPLLADAQAAQARNSLRLLLSGSEARKRAYLQTVTSDLAHHVSFSVAVPSTAAVELGATEVLQYKGLLQDAMSNAKERLQQDSTAGARQLLDELAIVANQFSNLIYQTPEESSPQSYRKRATELEREQQRLEVELGRRSAELSRQITPVRLAQVRALLPSDALLIEVLRYRPRDVSGTIFGTATQPAAPRYVAYLISQRNAPMVIDLGDAPSLDALVVDFRRAAGDPQRADYRTKAAALARRVYAPLQTHLRSYRQLLISPDGALNLVPMGALLDEHGKFLLERFEINYLSSGRDLLAMVAEKRVASEPLVIAAPNYGEASRNAVPPPAVALAQRSADLDRSGLRFRPLQGAMREGRDVGRLLGLGPRNVLLQSDATEAALKRLRSPSILHIATHGFFLSDQAALSELQRGSGNVTALPENPLLRSGLAFAGANVRRSGEREDGILTALELAQLDLRATKLVVLSACESGVGQVQNGDGVNGLRRALALAGAQAQLTSLWKVADVPTQQLMVDYYRRLLRGTGRAAALREAQLAIKASADYSHPYYWAAFVPIGDWRPLPDVGARGTQAASKPQR